jgi:hypothetical protein
MHKIHMVQTTPRNTHLCYRWQAKEFRAYNISKGIIYYDSKRKMDPNKFIHSVAATNPPSSCATWFQTKEV